MNSKNKASNKIILVPYPALGHITPMIMLASALANHGLEPMVAVPEFIHRRIGTTAGVSCVGIPDGLEEDHGVGQRPDFFAIERAMENHMPLHFENLVRKLDDRLDGNGVVCIVVDLLASWAIGVGHRCGVNVVGFWPVMLSAYHLIVDIPYMVHMGVISESGIPSHETPIYHEHGEFSPTTEDLPWLIGASDSKHLRFKFWTRTLQRSKTLKSLLVNTFPNESLHKLNHNDSPLILPVGPLIKQLPCRKNWSSEEDNTSCLAWLDMQISSSVIYISFGSWVSPIEEEKVRSLAMALEALDLPFVWVLGNEWRKGLPSGYLERVKKGYIVSWAPQIEVLQHEAIGCYLTHCGWNSIVEAIKFQKRMLCYPIAGDQFLNCGYIVKVWRIGVRISGFEEKQVEECVKKVMEDEEMKERLVKVKEMVMGKEVGSRVMNNLASFVDTIIV